MALLIAGSRQLTGCIFWQRRYAMQCAQRSGGCLPWVVEGYPKVGGVSDAVEVLDAWTCVPAAADRLAQPDYADAWLWGSLDMWAQKRPQELPPAAHSEFLSWLP